LNKGKKSGPIANNKHGKKRREAVTAKGKLNKPPKKKDQEYRFAKAITAEINSKNESTFATQAVSDGRSLKAVKIKTNPTTKDARVGKKKPVVSK